VISDLVSDGIPVYVQTPFLGGCNDSGPPLAKLFAQLRGAGAEMHYVFMPCSPLQGNGRFRAPISRGLEAAGYLRAHLTHRAIPLFCTATAIGKIDWGTSGWLVEVDEADPSFVWMRTPYSQEYFEEFTPILDLSQVARPNAEGTLDAQFMADEASMAAPAIVPSGNAALQRVHETRVELNCLAEEEDLDQALEFIADTRELTNVVVYTARGVAKSFSRLTRVVEQLAPLHHITSVRLKSQLFLSRPDTFTDGVIERLAQLNRLRVANPLRVELEALFLHSSEIKTAHGGVVRLLRQRGVTVYVNIPLLPFINDDPEEMPALTLACRRMGLELNHLVLTGMPLQKEWNDEHPVHLGEVIDLASHLREQGSGRELPSYILRTRLGEADFALGCEVLETLASGESLVRLFIYSMDDYRAIDPQFAPPPDVTFREDDHPVVRVRGLMA